MSRKPATTYLSESLEELAQSVAHLQYAARATAEIPQGLSGVSEEDLLKVEAFTSRFARVVDLITKRVLRALDHFELHDVGTLLDVANRAEKRGLIDSVDWLRELKDTRNRILHDYAGEHLPEILGYCREELPRLLAACDRTQAYASRLLQH